MYYTKVNSSLVSGACAMAGAAITCLAYVQFKGEDKKNFGMDTSQFPFSLLILNITKISLKSLIPGCLSGVLSTIAGKSIENDEKIIKAAAVAGIVAGISFAYLRITSSINIIPNILASTFTGVASGVSSLYFLKS